MSKHPKFVVAFVLAVASCGGSSSSSPDGGQPPGDAAGANAPDGLAADKAGGGGQGGASSPGPGTGGGAGQGTAAGGAGGLGAADGGRGEGADAGGGALGVGKDGGAMTDTALAHDAGLAGDGQTPAVDVMDVVRRLKAIPTGVMFVGLQFQGAPVPFVYVSFTAPLVIGQRQVPGPPGGYYSYIMPSATSPLAWHYGKLGEIVAQTPMTDAEIARTRIPKTVEVVEGPTTKRLAGTAMSIEDWIATNRNNLEEAIRNPR